MIVKFSIYIVNRVNGCRYIGSAVDVKQRFAIHTSLLNSGTHYNAHLQSAWNKYGKDAFEFIPLLICDKEMCCIYEQAVMDNYNPEYNICPRAANSLGYKHTKSARDKMSAALVGRRLSPKHRKTISIRLMGNEYAKGNHSRAGKKASESTRRKLRDSHLGIRQTPETIAKISKSMIGRLLSEASRDKISKSLLGHVVSKITRDKISKSLKEYNRNKRKV